MFIFILCALMLLHVSIPLFTRELSKITSLSRVAVTVASLPFIFLLLSLYAAVILSGPLLFLGAMYGGDSDDFCSTFLNIWLGSIFVLGVPLFGLSYLFGWMTVKLFYDRDDLDEIAYAYSSRSPIRNSSLLATSAMSKDDIGGLVSLAENVNSDSKTLERIYNYCRHRTGGSPTSPYWSVIYRIANNRSTPVDVLEELSHVESNPGVLQALRGNPAARAVLNIQ